MHLHDLIRDDVLSRIRYSMYDDVFNYVHNVVHTSIFLSVSRDIYGVVDSVAWHSVFNSIHDFMIDYEKA